MALVKNAVLVRKQQNLLDGIKTFSNFNCVVAPLVRNTKSSSNSYDPAGSRHLGSISRSSRMNSYSYKELVDMLIVCGAADCNEHATWQKCYPNRPVPPHTTVASVNER
ncbi:hypothetical protein TNCV_57271 [Trichonephila clavipes]|nr:hypothetical protein TNCV_57271 [Trichonephila clavipes]